MRLFQCKSYRNDLSMKRIYLYLLFIFILLCIGTIYIYLNHEAKQYADKKVVVCVPVYGQSYALGEEATRITDFDSLRIKYNGRIVTENLDYTFGYFDHSSQLKQWVKKILHYDKKSFELSVYGMAEVLAQELGEDSVICIFPGGHGMNTISELMKPVEPYNKFIREIARAYEKSEEKGWKFLVPAVCWMQGESDIVEYPQYDYKKKFQQMYTNLNNDIKAITHQDADIRIIMYQSNVITKGVKYKNNNFQAEEPRTPEAQMEMARDDSLIWVSGPTYPYHYVNESLHIDAVGQKKIGQLAALSVLGILRGENRRKGLIPLDYKVQGNDIFIYFNVPCPPLCLDTISVRKADNYGFNVIGSDNRDIVSDIILESNHVVVKCKESPIGCKIRYAINGKFWKGGNTFGPRGNLRDSQPLVTNWCYQFEIYEEN